jgi:precorrin-8X/cobalt-precorrin-8 methylmutase
MDFIKQPMEIENRSMEIIAPHLEGMNLSPEQVKVYSRLIHAAGDVDYAPIIKMSADAIEQAMMALKGGCDIYTDVEMVRTGINKRKLASFGGQVHCLIADEEVAKTAKEQGITRSMAAMRKFGAQMNGAIIAIGNAPTALIHIYELISEGRLDPRLVIGVPVGFVNVVQSKRLIMSAGVPCIVARGRKGGSNVAAAICNALLYMLGR